MLPKDTRLGPYLIEESLGGTTTEVYRAWDEQLRRSVAVKRLRAGAGAAARERFRRRAALAAELDHPSIVRIHTLLAGGGTGALGGETGTGGGGATGRGSGDGQSSGANTGAGGDGDLLVMELVAGEPLRRLLECGGIAAPLAQHVAAQLGDALAAAHARGVVHGDLTAERVMVRPDGRAKILGFGLADLAPAAAGGAHLAAAQRTDRDALDALLRQLASRTRSEPAALGELLAPAGEGPAGEGPAGTAADPPATAPRHRRRWPLGRGARRRVAAAGILAAAVGGGLALWRPAADPAYVAVAEPAVARGGGPQAARLSDGLRLALLHALLNLERIAPLSAPAGQGDGARPGLPPAGVARLVGAGEVLASRLSCRPLTCEVTLSRLTAGAGAAGSRLLWTETIETPAGQPYPLAVAVESALRRAYDGFAQRPGARPLDVRPADFDAFLVLRQRLHRGARTPPAAPDAAATAPDADLERLRALLAGSPRFVEALELEVALLARARPDAALALLRQAAELAPADPRPLCRQFELGLATGRFAAARQALAALDRRQPANAGNLVRRARLQAGRGQLQQARDDLRDAVRARPAAADLLYLAGLESRLGDRAAARTHLLQARARLAAGGGNASPAAGQRSNPGGGISDPGGSPILLTDDCGGEE
jgi:tetratricopeptide (TPR) repeat protein